MAEQDGQEKTEQPTGKKLNDARDKGQVAKSMEINSFAIFTFGFLLLFATRNLIGHLISSTTTQILSSLGQWQLSIDLIPKYAVKGFIFFLLVMSPILIGLFIVAVVTGSAQVGLKLSPKALEPKFNKLNIFKGIKEKFFSTTSVVEVLKSLVKLIVIGLFGYGVLKKYIFSSTTLVGMTVPEVVDFMLEAALALLWRVSLAFALVAAADFIFQKHKFKKDMMMTKQEVKEENKQVEGSPEIKARIRKEQLQAARKRMMDAVPNADVVITNPTHFAVALKYDIDRESAPRVVAKGMDVLAQRIKKIAIENDVPIHEDKQLARALFKICNVGDQIPANLFHTVARILAYIYQLKNYKKAKRIV